MSVTRLSKRYAKSLLELANEQDVLENVTRDVEGVISIIEGNKDFYLLLKSPIVKEDTKMKIFEKAFKGEVEELTLAFLKIVARKGRESYLLNILKAYKDQYNELKGIVPVTITSAVELGDDGEEDFKELLKEEFGKDEIELSKKVDEELVGGFILEFEDKRFDASVKHQLEEIKKEFHKQGRIKST